MCSSGTLGICSNTYLVAEAVSHNTNNTSQVLFHSYGDRLNPNLYDNGKVLNVDAVLILRVWLCCAKCVALLCYVYCSARRRATCVALLGFTLLCYVCCYVVLPVLLCCATAACVALLVFPLHESLSILLSSALCISLSTLLLCARGSLLSLSAHEALLYISVHV